MAVDEINQVMDADEIRRAIARISHEIIERNRGASDLVLIGIRRRGVPLAHRLAAEIARIEAAITPRSTRLRSRTRQVEAATPTLSASALLAIRPSARSASTMRWSRSSSP